MSYRGRPTQVATTHIRLVISVPRRTAIVQLVTINCPCGAAHNLKVLPAGSPAPGAQRTEHRRGRGSLSDYR
jgi:hypothetical protein